MTTRSTEEAMDVLNSYRKYLIEYGRYVATLICQEQGAVHSRDVRQALAGLGLLDDPNLNDYWLGAVFNKSLFRWTGGFHVYSDPARNIHERTIKLWNLPPGEPGYTKKPDPWSGAPEPARPPRAPREPYEVNAPPSWQSAFKFDPSK